MRIRAAKYAAVQRPPGANADEATGRARRLRAEGADLIAVFAVTVGLTAAAAGNS